MSTSRAFLIIVLSFTYLLFDVLYYLLGFLKTYEKSKRKPTRLYENLNFRVLSYKK